MARFGEESLITTSRPYIVVLEGHGSKYKEDMNSHIKGELWERYAIKRMNKAGKVVAYALTTLYILFIGLHYINNALRILAN